MAATVPNHDLDGFIKSMTEGVYGAFKRGVKYGRYLEQQEHPKRETGHWEHPGYARSRQYFCSVCSGKESAPRPFCPRCGTKMTEKRDGND